MQKLFTFFLIILISISLKAQEQKVEIVPDSLYTKIDRTDNQQVFLLRCGARGVLVELVSSDYFLPFNFYDFSSNEENWIDTQSIYNTIRSKVPGVMISPISNLNQVPTIRMRGDDNTIVIVDGIRYDASILNTLNPADIESITVAPSVAASNYLLNN